MIRSPARSFSLAGYTKHFETLKRKRRMNDEAEKAEMEQAAREAERAAAVAAAKIRPVLPSRAAGHMLGSLFPPNETPNMPMPEPMFSEPLPDPPRPQRGGPRSRKRALPAPKADPTPKKRKAAVPMTKKRKRAVNRAAPHGIGPRRSDASLASLSGKAPRRATIKQPPDHKLGAVMTRPPRKNPNRPLELKQQLTAVVTTMAALSSQPERLAFAAGMKMLDSLTRTGRRDVLAALTRVYA